jgi:cysteine desulfurase/selenocysteine lyase
MDGSARVLPYDVEAIKRKFPIFQREVKPGVPLVYLDSAATSQKPASVIQAMEEYYRTHNANIHRGIHTLAEEATAQYEEARQKVADFIQAPSAKQLVFTRNTTEAINLVAQTWGRQYLKAGDRILLTEMEHHSNLVPWLMLKEELGVQLDFISLTAEGIIDLDSFYQKLENNPKIVAFTHMSNVLGTINPAGELIQGAQAAGALTLVDAAQSVPHLPVDVSELDPDFLAFSAHKMCGPTGIGVLFGRMDLLEGMPPYMGGGEMIKSVTLDFFKPNDVPHKFEAGTPAIAEAIGFGAAIDFLSELGMDAVAAHEKQLIAYAMERLEEIPGVDMFGPDASQKGGVASFMVDGVHPHDVAQILDSVGVAVRAGHHCAQPLHDKFKVPATARASFYLYNTEEDVEKLVEGIYKVKKIFA